ncbi:MAG: tetratricopeptide repeat protein [bacterium]|nr:tetratricopeptide repeat protein [bacterium]
MLNKCWKVFLVFLLVVMFSLPLQSSVLCSVKGIISDQESGGPLPGVNVTLTFASLKYELTTDKKGYFYKSGLKNGIYQVKYEKDGYIPTIYNFRLRVSEKKDISFQLKALQVVQPVKAKKSIMKKGVELLNAGKYAEAVKKLTEAAEESPENPLIYYYRGFSFDKSGDPGKALDDYKKSLQLDPDLLISLSEVGKIYAKKGDLNNAVKHYKKAYDLDTKDILSLYNYAVCLINLGKNDEALKVLEKLLTVDPKYADAFYQLGIIYLGTNDNAKAKEYLQKFIEMDPENSNVAVAKEIIKTLN